MRTIHIVMALTLVMVTMAKPNPPRPPGGPDPGSCDHDTTKAEGGGRVCTKCGTYWPPHD